MTALSQDVHSFDLGEEIDIYINPKKVHLFDAESGNLVSSAVEER
jgi:hypothetical protein